jgi:hypothetical protein
MKVLGIKKTNLTFLNVGNDGFDVLLNKLDFAGAEKYWSPN